MIRRLIILLVIVGFMITSYKIYTHYEDKNCYSRCSDYHLTGESSHWNYNDFLIDNKDTIWVDKECYNQWCICIDECKPGLCCEFLN